MKGVVPILAHPERYTELMTKPDLLLRWRREGLLLQCNIGSFAGYFGAQAEQAAKLLLANGLVDLWAVMRTGTVGAIRICAPVLL